MSVERAAAVLAVACFAWPVIAQEPITSAAPARIEIPGGAFTYGVSDADRAYAIALCESDLEVEISPLDPHGCMGERFLAEWPAHRASIPTFALDRDEVTNARYRRCVSAGVCAPSSVREHDALGAPSHPVVGIRWSDADAFCRFAGGRLPTELEWEKAARGDDDERRFPWGRIYDAHAANHGRSPMRTDPLDGFLVSSPVGSFAGDVSPYGVRDMAGNVSEWTADTASAPVDYGVDLSPYRVVRGGSYMQAITTLRVTARAWATPDTAAGDVGVRCAYDSPRR